MNLRITKGRYCSRQVIEKEFSTKYKGFSDNLPIEEFYRFHSQVLRELLRTSKIIFYNIQVVTGSKQAFFRIIGEFYDKLKEIIIWDKGHGQPAMHEGVLNRQSELILVFEDQGAISRHFEKHNFNRGTLSDTWKISRGKKPTKDHGAVFPEELVATVLKNFSNEGDVVYDPFMGSGTTAAVSLDLNRKFIGSELSGFYFDFVKNRIQSKGSDHDERRNF